VTGVLFGRGHLLAVAHGEGVYEADLQRAAAEMRYAIGIEEKDRHEQRIDQRSILRRLVSNTMARSCAVHEEISSTEVDLARNLLRSQFRDEKTWRTALRASGLSASSLRREIIADLRAGQWILGQIKPQVDVTTQECRSFYDAHSQNFSQPVRLRTSHLFLAAPTETPPEIVDMKRVAIESFSNRLAHGENFADLVAEVSEDEATRGHGGDIGYFSAFRMPPDFFPTAMKLRLGQISQPIRTRLGFHIIQLTDLKPGLQMPFDEARAEIAIMLGNQKRCASLDKLIIDLSARAEWLQFSL
jgi:parvulin-like peptidyl-prolyl isomerase